MHWPTSQVSTPLVWWHLCRVTHQPAASYGSETVRQSTKTITLTRIYTWILICRARFYFCKLVIITPSSKVGDDEFLSLLHAVKTRRPFVSLKNAAGPLLIQWETRYLYFIFFFGGGDAQTCRRVFYDLGDKDDTQETCILTRAPFWRYLWPAWQIYCSPPVSS